ncbi:DUF4747 family protein [Chitiniphilus shinanonensis]|uniref:DUF4747 family protein n=1 Tax=Chitiniphilus shinanonensis TaxID=553088 RepID=UPI00303F15B0
MEKAVARTRTIEIGCLNIVTHPHTPQGYVELLYMAHALRRTVATRKDQRLLIGEVRNLVREEPLEGLVGRLYRFTEIDPDGEWLNLETQAAAEPDELGAVQIPANLRPNMEMFDFVFYPRNHQMYVELRSTGKSLSIAQAQKLWKEVFAAPAITEQFGDVEVMIVPDTEALRAILLLPSLYKITIDLIKPNPDEFERASRNVYGRLARMNARRLQQTITAERRERLELDEEEKELALVAAHNGSVVGQGLGPNGRVVTMSTDETPWSDKIIYDPNLTLPMDALVEGTQREVGER